jgi:hypothetical protein
MSPRRTTAGSQPRSAETGALPRHEACHWLGAAPTPGSRNRPCGAEGSPPARSVIEQSSNAVADRERPPAPGGIGHEQPRQRRHRECPREHEGRAERPQGKKPEIRQTRATRQMATDRSDSSRPAPPLAHARRLRLRQQAQPDGRPRLAHGRLPSPSASAGRLRSHLRNARKAVGLGLFSPRRKDLTGVVRVAMVKAQGVARGVEKHRLVADTAVDQVCHELDSLCF